MKKEFLISEKDLETAIIQFIKECDADELGRIAGDIFGGECLWSEKDANPTNLADYYLFTPNEFYGGGLDDF